MGQLFRTHYIGITTPNTSESFIYYCVALHVVEAGLQKFMIMAKSLMENLSRSIQPALIVQNFL